MSTSIVMPQLGESVAEGVIGKWLKSEGDRIEKDEPIVEIITDKVNAEIPSPVAGMLAHLVQPEGATVAVGQEIAVIEDGSEPSSRTPSQGGREESASSDSNGGRPHFGGDSGAFFSSSSSGGGVATASPETIVSGTRLERSDRVRSSPLVRRLAEQHGITLAEVPGTGIGGRVSKQDILSFVEAHAGGAAIAQSPAATETMVQPPRDIAAAPQMQPISVAPAAVPTISTPSPSPRPSGARELGPGEELIAVPTLRKIIAERMAQSVYTIPHAMTMAEVDMTAVVRYRDVHKDEFRRREGVPLSFVAFAVKTTVEALKEFPMVNAEWTADGIVLKHDINISIAVDAPEGLTTPAIHHADERSLAGLSKAIYDLATRARNKRLKIEDMQGGTFTVNNTGAIGSTGGFSIINYPQAGILNAAAIVKRPVVLEQDGQDLIAIRSMMNLSFSFDHRLLDGGYAAGFVQAVKGKLEGWPADYPLY